jgi:hypothetical protein
MHSSENENFNPLDQHSQKIADKYFWLGGAPRNTQVRGLFENMRGFIQEYSYKVPRETGFLLSEIPEETAYKQYPKKKDWLNRFFEVRGAYRQSYPSPQQGVLRYAPQQMSGDAKTFSFALDTLTISRSIESSLEDDSPLKQLLAAQDGDLTISTKNRTITNSEGEEIRSYHFNSSLRKEIDRHSHFTLDGRSIDAKTRDHFVQNHALGKYKNGLPASINCGWVSADVEELEQSQEPSTFSRERMATRSSERRLRGS